MLSIGGARVPYRHIEDINILLIGLVGEVRPLVVIGVLKEMEMKVVKRTNNLLYFEPITPNTEIIIVINRLS